MPISFPNDFLKSIPGPFSAVAAVIRMELYLENMEKI
jgi:hypothetical protein